MATADKKDPPNFALLLSKRMGGDGAPPGAAGAGDAPEGNQQDDMENSAISSLIDSLHSKDVEGAKSALSDFLEMHQSKSDPADTDDESAGEPEEEADPGAM